MGEAHTGRGLGEAGLAQHLGLKGMGDTPMAALIRGVDSSGM
ncbi:hypothetical protein [Streptomyces halobius]|nr:hypothetical protein [Streptomyces halobius]